MKTRLLLFAFGLILAATAPLARALDADVRQLIVSIAPDWNSQQGRLWLFQRDAGGAWQLSGGPIPVLYGKNGLAWGRGLLGTEEPGSHKKERDGRAPAGVFKMGTIYTYDAALPAGADYPFHQVTLSDAWVDNPASPDYNRHVVIDDPKNPPPWFEKAKMRHNDFAYRWLVEIRHNSDPPVSGEGSAIFFHIRRGETRPTSGCTTMAEPNLVRLIRWLRARANPHYALLPKAEYDKKWRAWGLPDPSLLATKP
jgi:L,D-peptidoglycan transpeptidase YkuD (ErfK/YbiS/YcfS/YnhG family)